MNYDQLIKLCKPVDISGDEPYFMGSLRQDSRKVEEDDVFIAIRGNTTDGHQYMEDAIARGASVIICEEPYYTRTKGVSIIEVEETRPLLGILAQAFENDPAKQLSVIGVTGTNGKTTVATLIWQALKKLDTTPALLGTVSKQYAGKVFDSKLTTSDPIELAADMRAMADEGCTHLVMEVSSHALEQQRTAGIDFSIGVFTNLSHDHLDYHDNMESYADAKKKLFNGLKEDSWAVINRDDNNADRIVSDCKAKILGFSFKNKSQIYCKLTESGENGMKIQVGDMPIDTPLIGRFNAYNVTAAFLSCTALGFDANLAAEAIAQSNGAPGRLEKVTPADKLKKLPLVLVDYAHTPDALDNVASTLSEIKNEDQELVIIFGCGGDRDRKKRPEMAKIAETYADRVVVTSDNPRTEDPESIIKEISQGFSAGIKWISIPSRKKAITDTVKDASADSIILIAGKGHETYQEINEERIDFDDRKVAEIALRSRSTFKKWTGGL